MSVKINLPSYLQQFTNDTEVIEVDGTTVDECLKQLVNQFPSIKPKVFGKNGKLLDYASIYIDGDFIYGDGLDKPVKDGDELHVIYIIGGG